MASAGGDPACGLPVVLLTNDDGIEAPGIQALAKVLGQEGFCTVHVCAPDVERSAISHALSVHETVEARLVEDYKGASIAYALSGTPADCASIGVMTTDLFGPTKPKLVVSGINKGGNTGLHCIYSGTVAGAREAHMCGVPAIAVSLDWAADSSDAMFEAAAKASVPIILASLMASVNGSFPRSFLLNVNVPANPAKSLGVMYASQGATRVAGGMWVRHEKRRTGMQVAAGRGAGIALPGMMMGRGVGGIALPGMSPEAGGRPKPGLSVAQLGAAAAAKGAARSGTGDDKAGDESEPHVPKHHLHFRHSIGTWQLDSEADDADTVLLGKGYTTITALPLIGAVPTLEQVLEQAEWVAPLLT